MSTNIIIPSLIGATIIGGVTIVSLLNIGLWPIIVPAGLILGVTGIVIGNKQITKQPELDKLRLRIVLVTLLISIITYLIAGIVASSQQANSLTAFTVIALLPILFPLYFGLSQLLAIALTNNK